MCLIETSVAYILNIYTLNTFWALTTSGKLHTHTDLLNNQKILK